MALNNLPLFTITITVSRETAVASLDMPHDVRLGILGHYIACTYIHWFRPALCMLDKEEPPGQNRRHPLECATLPMA